MSELKNYVITQGAHSEARPRSTAPILLFLFAALIAALTLSSLPAQALDITSERTDNHVMVPGANAYFAPAPGLVRATSFTGFESRNRRIEVIAAHLDGPISSIEEGFTEDSFASLGMELLAKGEFTIDERRAVLYKVLHNDGNFRWGKWVMLADSGVGTLVVNAVFVSGDAEASVDLEQMLKGVYIETATAGSSAQTTNPVDNFDRNEALSRLAGQVAGPPNTAGDDTEEEETPAEVPERTTPARIITEDGIITVGE